MSVNFQKIREELCVFLRNSDIMSTAVRGVATATDSWVAAGAQNVFTVTRPGLKNVRAVRLNVAPLAYGHDYLVNYHSGDVTLTNPTSAGDTLEIDYDHGEGDKIYSDLPRLDLDLTSYPRVGFDDISHANSEQALNATLIRTDILVSMVVYADKKDTVLEIWQAARDAIVANKKSFYHFCFVTLAGAGPMAQSAGRHDEIIQKNQDFRIPFEYEVT